jgi:hypothetical protein
MLSGVQRVQRVWGNEPSHSQVNSHVGSWWEWSPKRTPKTSESVLRGQNSMACCALYNNGKLLKCRCLKWARIAHLNIWNTSYGQKKAWESNSRESASFDSWPLKVGNRPLPDIRSESATQRGKLSMRATTLLQITSRSDSAVGRYRSPKSRDSNPGQFWDSHAGVPGKIAIWMPPPPQAAEYTIRGKVVASPKSGPWWVLCVRVARGSS